MTKLAIVTTVYNDYALLPSLLKCMLAQTSNNFVHYIYDDGSENIDKALIQSYIEKASLLPKPFKVCFMEGECNLGCQKAHEYMFRYIDEAYFTWVDSDDCVNKNFVKIIEGYIYRYPNTDVFHLNSFVYFDKDFKVRKKHSTGSRWYYPRSYLTNPDQIMAYCFGWDSNFMHNFVVNKKSLEDVNPSLTIFDTNKEGYHTTWYDAQIMFELSLAGKSFRFIKEPISYIYILESHLLAETQKQIGCQWKNKS